jgi:hypothetical protein
MGSVGLIKVHLKQTKSTAKRRRINTRLTGIYKRNIKKAKKRSKKMYITRICLSRGGIIAV